MKQTYEERIRFLLERSGKKGLKYLDLWKRSHLNVHKQEEFDRVLLELLRRGRVKEHRHHFRWVGEAPAKKQELHATVVRLCGTFGFAQSEDGVECFIPGRELRGALPGDKVLLREIDGRGGKPTFAVTRIVRQSDEPFTGVIVKTREGSFVVPDEMPREQFALDRRKNVRAGDKVICKITHRGDSHREHRAEVLESFGSAEQAAACAAALLEQSGVEAAFPFAVQEEARMAAAKHITEREWRGRLDLRDERIFTIDGATSKDLDDAVSIHRYQSGWQLGVHIADVSHYVLPHTPLDDEAFRRGTSIYYADQVVPMLPKELSNGICSLNPKEERLAFSCLMTLSPEGELEDFAFRKSVICSRVKGVYDEVNALLDGSATDEVRQKYRGLEQSLWDMAELAKRRIKLGDARGVLRFETAEVKIQTDEQGVAIDLSRRTRGMAEQMIEEFMLLANQAAAMAAAHREVPLVYRVHEAPSAEKTAQLRTVLEALQWQAPALSDPPQQAQFAALLQEAKGKPLEPLLSQTVLRSMAKARYDEQPLGHYGLALKHYAHFTSPIRRYPDLMVHRVLSALAKEEPPAEISRRMTKAVVRAAKQSTECELLAQQIERRCDSFYCAEAMRSKVGEVFEATITAASPQGLFALLDNGAEGLLPVEALPAGEYWYDELFSYENTLSGERFVVGDRMLVRIAAVNVNAGQIDFEWKGWVR